MLRIPSISVPRESTASSCRCSWQIRKLTWCSLLWSSPMKPSGILRALALECGIGLAISHLFASNIQRSPWSALQSGILNIWRILLPFVVGPYRLSHHLKRQPGLLLRSGVIPRHERNQRTKDLILVKVEQAHGQYFGKRQWGFVFCGMDWPRRPDLIEQAARPRVIFLVRYSTSLFGRDLRGTSILLTALIMAIVCLAAASNARRPSSTFWLVGSPTPP